MQVVKTRILTFNGTLLLSERHELEETKIIAVPQKINSNSLEHLRFTRFDCKLQL